MAEVAGRNAGCLRLYLEGIALLHQSDGTCQFGEAVDRFVAQGIAELGDKLGPINWQFEATKKFERDDFNRFLSLLPQEVGGLPLRHAVEVRHPSFMTEEFYELAAAHGVAVTHTDSELFPNIDQPTASFAYARLMRSDDDLEEGYSDAHMRGIAQQARGWSERGEVFIYFVAGAKVRNPAAAQALLRTLA